MPLTIRVITFNAGRVKLDPKVFASQLFSGPSKSAVSPDILVLCLQEVAPVAYSFLGGSYLFPYLQKFEHAVNIAAKSLDGRSFAKAGVKNVGMTAVMIFTDQDRASRIQSIQYAEVGVGLWGMGNKGAAAIRLKYATDSSEIASLTFVSAHLAAMEDACGRRNQDYKNIVRGLVFQSASPQASLETSSEVEEAPLLSTADRAQKPASDPISGIYTPASHLIVAGDLNYRTASNGPSPEERSYFPQPCEDDSYPQHYEHLLPSDQLAREMRAGKTCQGLKEAPIDFPPSYKYSTHARNGVATGLVKPEDMDDPTGGKWHWAEHRWPSWCDRVLYLETPSWMEGPGVVVEQYTALPLMATSDHRPVACTLRIPKEAIPEPSRQDVASGDVQVRPPFSVDPHWKSKRQAARQREIIVGILALLTTTWEGLWTVSALVLFGIILGTGISWWQT